MAKPPGCNTKKTTAAAQAAIVARQAEAFRANHWAGPFYEPENSRKKQILVTDANFLLFRPIYMVPDQELSNSRITAINLIPNSVIASAGGVDMPANYSYGLLCLVDRCQEVIVTIPLQDLNAAANGNKKQMFWIEKPVWNECYILLTGAGLTSANGILMDIYYKPL